jgi:hypothetical protein
LKLSIIFAIFANPEKGFSEEFKFVLFLNDEMFLNAFFPTLNHHKIIKVGNNNNTIKMRVNIISKYIKQVYNKYSNQSIYICVKIFIVINNEEIL